MIWLLIQWITYREPAFYEGEQDNKSLTHYLLSKLPKFMIPEVMINVKSMPLTKNGKIDRKALMEEYNA